MAKLSTLNLNTNVKVCNNPDCSSFRKIAFWEGKSSCPYCQRILMLEKDYQVKDYEYER
jgi:hypothetical protein